MKSASGTPAACARRSIRRRITYSLRSNSSSPPERRSTNSWRTTGSQARASAPIALESTGTSRKPSARCPVAPGLGQAAEQRLGLNPQEPVGQLHHDAGAVAGLGIGAGGAAVLEAPQRAGRALEQLVGLLAVQPYERPEPA